eukprot:scaffold35980_cov49-Attheya_sp.AAC.2
MITDKTAESPNVPVVVEKEHKETNVVEKKPSKRRIGKREKGTDTSMHETDIPRQEANESVEITRSNERKNQSISMEKNGNVDHQHQPRTTELQVVKEEKPIRKERRNGDDGHEKEPKKPRLSAVEARRQKFLKRTTAGGGSKSASTQEDTLAKLAAFRSKVLSMKSSSKSTDSKNNDTSLASRMAQRHDKTTNDEESMNGDDAAADGGATYHGQILESDEDEDGDTFKDAGRKATDWLGTKFKCGRHVDHASRGLNTGGDRDSTDNMVDGGDGRNVDQYEVIDSKKHVDGMAKTTGTSNPKPSHHGKHHRHHPHEKRSQKEPNSTSRHKRHRR